MKLLAMAMCIVCFPAFGQDLSTLEQQRTMERLLLPLARRTQTEIIERAIGLHQAFWMTDAYLGSIVMTATGVKDEGDMLTLTGVEFKTNSVAVTADQVIYDRTTHQIEPRGNVHIKPLPSH
jgi:lipopolysaccharide assembly outer membrane protein LptD (OstA)